MRDTKVPAVAGGACLNESFKQLHGRFTKVSRAAQTDTITKSANWLEFEPLYSPRPDVLFLVGVAASDGAILWS